MNVALFDYGVGNLHSLAKALEAGGARVRVEADPAAALAADALVLPGVGAFSPAADRLAGGREAIRAAIERGFPCLGICLGMQLLFDASEEGPGRGLGVLPGRVRRLRAARVPQIGWNSAVRVRGDSPTADGATCRGEPAATDPIFAGAGEPVVYYANSFVAEPDDAARVLAWTEYDGDRFPAAVRRARCWGLQFHPEKSGALGLRMLRGFLAAVRADRAADGDADRDAGPLTDRERRR